MNICIRTININKTLVAVLSILAFFYSCTTQTRNNEKQTDAFQLKRGINISHWLSQNPDISENRKNIFTAGDVNYIAGLGFDHVRIPIDEEHLWDEKGNRNEMSFSLLHDAIGWCQNNKLRVILDLHQIRSHTFNSKNNLLWTSQQAQQQFVKMWLSLSNEFSKYPTQNLAYELLNEAVADSSSQWNSLLKTTIDSLRKYEPERKIIIGSNRWQSPDTFDELVVPANDSNIILSFHFYAPHAFTHYRASWMTSGNYTGDVKYPGQIIEENDLLGYPDSIVQPIRESNGYYTRDSLQKLMREPIQYAQKHNLQLYCGEFGAMPTVRRGDRLAWYADVRLILEENNIAWCSWDYKGLFGIFYPNANADEHLIKALINKQ